MKRKLRPSVIPLNAVMKRTQRTPSGSTTLYSCDHCNCQCGGCNR